MVIGGGRLSLIKRERNVFEALLVINWEQYSWLDILKVVRWRPWDGNQELVNWQLLCDKYLILTFIFIFGSLILGERSFIPVASTDQMTKKQTNRAVVAESLWGPGGGCRNNNCPSTLVYVHVCMHIANLIFIDFVNAMETLCGGKARIKESSKWANNHIWLKNHVQWHYTQWDGSNCPPSSLPPISSNERAT